jgi:hypothetical protein
MKGRRLKRGTCKIKKQTILREIDNRKERERNSEARREERKRGREGRKEGRKK